MLGNGTEGAAGRPGWVCRWRGLQLCRVHGEGPKGRPPVLRLSRLSGQLPQDWKSSLTQAHSGSSVMLKSISLGHDRLLPVCKEGPGGGR